MCCMAITGDATAWWGMPKYPQFRGKQELYSKGSPNALEDLGFELIPFFCPLESPKNVQTYVALFFLLFIVLGSLLKPNGRFILQRTWHLTTVMYLCRWLCVPLTFLPNPNPACFNGEVLVDDETGPYEQQNVFSYFLRVGKKFPPTSCGNLVFSGHAAVTCVHLMVHMKYELWGPWMVQQALRPAGGGCGRGAPSRGSRSRWNKVYLIPITLATVGWVSTVSCRSHYTVDVVLGVMISWLIVELFDTYVFQRWRGIAEWEMRKVRRIVWVEDEEGEEEEGFSISCERAAISCGEIQVVRIRNDNV